MTARIDGFKGRTSYVMDKSDIIKNARDSIKIHQDIVVDKFLLFGRLAVTVAYTGTAPKLNPNGVLDGVIDELILSRKGTDRVRAYMGTRHLIHTADRHIAELDKPQYKVNAADLSGTVLEGIPTLGATGQTTQVMECVPIMMSNVLSGALDLTAFSTQGLQTATINLKYGDFMNIFDPEDANVANVTSVTVTGTIEVIAHCADSLLSDPKIGQADFVQTSEGKDFSGAQSGSKQFYSPEGLLQGILITGLHSGRKPFDLKNMEKTYIEIFYLGVMVHQGTLAQLRELDLVGTIASRRKGSCYVSFLRNFAADSGLYIGSGKQLEVKVTTDPTLSYSPSPVQLMFEYDQLIFKPTEQAKVVA